jgi:outer membrane receptor protein involved in Fe transport
MPRTIRRALYACTVPAIIVACCFSAVLPAAAQTPAPIAEAAPATPTVAAPVAVGSVAAPRLQLPEVVSSTRRHRGVQEMDLDRSVHVVGAERLRQQQPENLPAAVALLPGVNGQATNRGAGSPLLRGLIGPQNLILIEGLRFNNSAFRTGPNQYLATIDPSAIDRVELMLGPGGVTYGSDAMGGVIGLHLAPLLPFGAENPFRARLWTQYGGADSTTASGGQAAWTLGRLSLSAGGAYRNHGTLYAGHDSVTRFSGMAADGEAYASDYRQWGWRARAALQLDGGWQAQAAVLHNGIDGAGRTDSLGRGQLLTYDNRDLFAWAEVRRDATAGVLRELRIALVTHQQREVGTTARCTLSSGLVADLRGCATTAQQVNAGLPATLPAAITRHDQTTDEVTTLGGLATARLALAEDRLLLTLGGEAWFDRVDATARQRKNSPTGTAAWASLPRGNFSNGSTYAQLGAFGHVDFKAWQGGDWAALVNAGGRAGLVSARADAVPTYGDVAFDLPVMAATAGAVLQHARGVALFANVSTGLRAPNLQETTVLGDTGNDYEVPNPDLQSERIQAAELGLRLRAGGFRALVSGFYSQIAGFIDRAAVASSAYAGLGITADKLGCSALGDSKCKGVARRVNASDATISGAELTLQTPEMAGVRLWLNGTWLQGEAVQAGVTRPLRRATPTQGALGLRWTALGGALYLEPWVRGAAAQDQLNGDNGKPDAKKGEVGGDRTDLRICEDPAKGAPLAGTTCTGTPGWVTINVRAGYRWEMATPALRALRLDVDAGNLLDVRYRIHGSGFDAPGRGVLATLAAEW